MVGDPGIKFGTILKSLFFLYFTVGYGDTIELSLEKCIEHVGFCIDYSCNS